MNEMNDKPQFNYEEFEDNLFMAIQHARSLNVEDVCEYEEVLSYLRLAEGEIRMFIRNMRSRDMKEEKLDGIV